MTNESGKLNKNVKLKALRLNNLFPRVINNEKVLILQAGEHHDFSPCVLVIQGHEDSPPKKRNRCHTSKGEISAGLCRKGSL